MSLDFANLVLELRSGEQPSGQRQAPATGHSGTSFWHEVVAHVAAEAGIDPGLAVGVAAQESDLNPNALNHSSGAVGIMQLMPSTAAALGVNPRDVLENITGGIRYLREQLQNFGDKAKALAAYNWGPRHVTEAVEQWGADWLRHTPGETQHYVASILARSDSGQAITGLSNALHEAVLQPSEASALPSTPQANLIAEAVRLRSAMNAYLLSEILD